MRIVVALGGNALLKRGDKPDAAIQLRQLNTAALTDIAALLARTVGTTIARGIHASVNGAPRRTGTSD